MFRRIPLLLATLLFLLAACDQEVPTAPAAGSVPSNEASPDLVAGQIEAELGQPAEPLAITPPSMSMVLASLGPAWLQITPQSPTSVSNCIPFGTNTQFGFTGFIYRDVEPFKLRTGMQFGFDLGALNDVDVRRDIYFAVANKNPAAPVLVGGNVVSQGISALAWTQVASDGQTPETPRGNTVIDDYELRYTAEADFDFPGGGLIVGVAGSPPASYVDAGCEQVLVTTRSTDASGHFYSRFFSKPHLHAGLLDDITVGGSGSELGGIIIERALPVSVDVHPGSCPNPVNVKSKGVLPLAILGMAGFEVADIDPATVRLEGVPALRSSVSDVGTPYTADLIGSRSCNTFGADGFVDLTLKFRMQNVVAALGAVGDRDEIVLELTGYLRDGTPIVGHDIVWILAK